MLGDLAAHGGGSGRRQARRIRRSAAEEQQDAPQDANATLRCASRPRRLDAAATAACSSATRASSPPEPMARTRACCPAEKMKDYKLPRAVPDPLAGPLSRLDPRLQGRRAGLLELQRRRAVHRMDPAGRAGAALRRQAGMGQRQDARHQSAGSERVPQAEVPQRLAVHIGCGRVLTCKMPTGTSAADREVCSTTTAIAAGAAIYWFHASPLSGRTRLDRCLSIGADCQCPRSARARCGRWCAARTPPYPP